jgi:hypothetical protein
MTDRRDDNTDRGPSMMLLSPIPVAGIGDPDRDPELRLRAFDVMASEWKISGRWVSG